MQTRQTNVRKEVLFQIDLKHFSLIQTRQTNVRKGVFFQVDVLGWVEKRRVSRAKQGREFFENHFSLMQTRQTNVRKEVLFQIDF